MIHCNAHDFTQAGPWQPGLKGGVSVGKQHSQRECLSHETWHAQDSLGRNYLPPSLCIWVCACPSWPMSARKGFSSSLPCQDLGTLSCGTQSQNSQVETGGWQGFGASQDYMVRLLPLKKGQVSGSFKQAEETPTKSSSVPHPKVFCFVSFAEWRGSLLNFLTERNTKHPVHLEMLPPAPVSTSITGTWPRHT